jgi:RNA polymerase sigma factor (sigma-70 family)
MSKPNKVKKVSVKGLGIELQNTRSEKVFKQLYDITKPSVINYYKNFPGNSIEIIEDAFNETMISIWNNIHKYDVNKYSISTLIYLKVKNNLIDNLKKTNSGKINSNSSNYGDLIAMENNIQNNSINEMSENLEIDFLKQEKSNNFWKVLRNVLGTTNTYDIFYDLISNNYNTNEICEKYNVSPQIVANRIFNVKKKIQENPQIFKSFMYEI